MTIDLQFLAPNVGIDAAKSHHRQEVVVMIIFTLGQTCALIHAAGQSENSVIITAIVLLC